MEDKTYILNKILDELIMLSVNIARLRSYIERNKIEDKDCLSLLNEQLDTMVKYRDVLRTRIEKGYY